MDGMRGAGLARKKHCKSIAPLFPNLFNIQLIVKNNHWYRVAHQIQKIALILFTFFGFFPHR